MTRPQHNAEDHATDRGLCAVRGPVSCKKPKNKETLWRCAMLVSRAWPRGNHVVTATSGELASAEQSRGTAWALLPVRPHRGVHGFNPTQVVQHSAAERLRAVAGTRCSAHLREELEGEEAQLPAAVAGVVPAVAAVVRVLRQIVLYRLRLHTGASVPLCCGSITRLTHWRIASVLTPMPNRHGWVIGPVGVGRPSRPGDFSNHDIGGSRATEPWQSAVGSRRGEGGGAGGPAPF